MNLDPGTSRRKLAEFSSLMESRLLLHLGFPTAPSLAYARDRLNRVQNYMDDPEFRDPVATAFYSFLTWAIEEDLL